MYRTHSRRKYVVKKSKRKSIRKSIKKSKRKSKTPVRCRNLLSRKIRANIDEFKTGRYSSRAQAIAVSYAQSSKKYPSCKRYWRRK